MPPVPSPLPTPAPTPMQIYQDALARYQAANPYAMATPTATPVSSAGAPNPLQTAASTAMQIYAKREIAKQLASKAASSTAPEILSTTRLGADAATGASSAAPEIISTTRIPGAANATGSFWTTAPENYSANQVLSGAAALHGGYTAFNDWQHGGSGRAGLTQAGAGVGNIIGGPIGGAIGAGFGNIMGYGLQGNGIKNKLALALTAPPLLVAKLLGFDPVHKTTKQFQQEHNQELSKMGADDSVWQNYVMGMRQGFGTTGPADPSKPFAGKYATWDAYKKAGLDANDLTGVYGNLKTFGPDWAKISEDQRKKITQELINADLYKSKKGEVEITDENKAKEIYKASIDKFMKEAKK